MLTIDGQKLWLSFENMFQVRSFSENTMVYGAFNLPEIASNAIN